MDYKLSVYPYNTSANKYVGPPYFRADRYAGRVACCPLVSHAEYSDGTDKRTDGRILDRYITLSAINVASLVSTSETVSELTCKISVETNLLLFTM